MLLHLCAVFFGPESLLAVHVDHGLQAAARRFEAQARRTCRDWGIQLRVKRLKGSPLKGESIEAWARTARYQALAETAQQLAIQHVFTAHHQDDQLETLLIALSRGAGLDGLSGIAPNRRLQLDTDASSADLDAIVLHRPLLACPRASLMTYALEHGLQWIEDPSNQDPRFLRNRIRLELLPVLRQTLPAFADQASRSLVHLRAATELLRLSPATLGASLQLSRRALKALSAPEQAFALRAWLRAHHLRAPSQTKLEEIRKQLVQSRAGTVCVQHEGKSLCRERDRLWIEAGRQGEIALLGGTALANDSQGALTSRAGPQVGSSNPRQPTASSGPEKTPQGWIWRLPAFKGYLLIKRHGNTEDELSQLSSLTIAPPRSAQKMRIAANTPRKTLKNLFQASGIPAELRKRLPCVTHGEDVLFVAGLGTASDAPWKFEFLPDL